MQSSRFFKGKGMKIPLMGSGKPRMKVRLDGKYVIE